VKAVFGVKLKKSFQNTKVINIMEPLNLWHQKIHAL